jgi:methyl-accepting chemotaxis protein
VAINIPLVSEYNPKGVKAAIEDFKRLDTTSQKASFALKKAFVPATAALGGLAAAAVPAINAASDLEESMSKVGVIFGEGADEIEAFAETAAKELGQSKQAVLDAAGTFGTFGKAAGLANEDLAVFSNDLTALASDMASFNNAEPEEVIEAIGAGLRGESEPLRRFGVLLNDATLKAEAMALGIYDGTGALTDQQKILAAQEAIFKQTGDAQGDFQRTSEGLANQSRIMKAQFEDVTAELGAALLPIVLKILPVFADLADFVSENTDLVLILAGVIGGLATAVVVANIAMKLWAGAQAIATAATWLFNAALAANPIVLIVAAIAALVAGLIILEAKFGIVTAALEKLMGIFDKVRDGIGWLAEKLGLVSDEVDNFERTTDTAREQAGDMYESVRELGDGVGGARDQFERAIGPTEEFQRTVKKAGESSEKTARFMDTLWTSTDKLYSGMFKLNPEVQRYLDQLDREQAVRDFNTAVEEFEEIAKSNKEGSDEWEEANKRVNEELANVITTMKNVPQEVQTEMFILVETGQLDAAIQKAERLAEVLAFNVATPSEFGGGTGNVPGMSDLQAALQSSGFVGSTTTNANQPGQRPTPELAAMAKGGIVTRPTVALIGEAGPEAVIPLSGSRGMGNTYNITVNGGISNSADIGQAVVNAIRAYNRTSGPARISVA